MGLMYRKDNLKAVATVDQRRTVARPKSMARPLALIGQISCACAAP